jgi:hypothetical protein
MVISGLLNSGLPFAILTIFSDYSLSANLTLSIICGLFISIGLNYALFNDNLDRLRNDIGAQGMIEDRTFSLFRNFWGFYKNMSGRTLAAHVLGVVGSFCWITALGIYTNTLTLHGEQSYDQLLAEKKQRIESVQQQQKELRTEYKKLLDTDVEKGNEYQEALKDRNDGISWNDAEPRRIMRKIKEDHAAAITAVKAQQLILNQELQSINKHYDPLISKAATEKTQFNFFAVLGHLTVGGFIAFGLFIAWVISTSVDGTGMSVSMQRFVRNRYFREFERAVKAVHQDVDSSSGLNGNLSITPRESHTRSHPQSQENHHTKNGHILNLVVKNDKNGAHPTPNESQPSEIQQKILDSWDMGIRNRSEISRRVGCDRAYVIRTLQKYRADSYARITAAEKEAVRKPMSEKVKKFLTDRKNNNLDKFRYSANWEAK